MFYRGTTPTIILSIKGISVNSIVDWYVNIEQDNIVLVKRNEDIQIIDNELHIKLSQEETLDFRGDSPVNIQIRAVTDKELRIASPIKTAFIGNILYDEVI